MLLRLLTVHVPRLCSARKNLTVAHTYHAGALWAGSFTIIHACSALRCSGPTFAYACTLHNSAWMMVLAFIHARAVFDGGRELFYRLNALATPVVKRCWAHPLQVNVQSPVRAFEIAMPPSTNFTQSQFHPPCARWHIATGAWVGSFQ